MPVASRITNPCLENAGKVLQEFVNLVGLVEETSQPIDLQSPHSSHGVRVDSEDVFRIDTYAVGRMRTLKITRLRGLFDEADQIHEFLKHLSGILEAGISDA